MNKTFISGLNNLSSLVCRQFARQVAEILLSTIQSTILNAVAVQVTSFSSNSNGTSTIAMVKITLIDNMKNSPVVHAVQVQSSIESGISSGKLTPLNISQIYVKG